MIAVWPPVLQLRSRTCYTRRFVYVRSLGLPTRYSSEQVLRKDVEDFRFSPTPTPTPRKDVNP
jgi:hypothetical protein